MGDIECLSPRCLVQNLQRSAARWRGEALRLHLLLGNNVSARSPHRCPGAPCAANGTPNLSTQQQCGSLAAAEACYLHWRREAGHLSCRLNGVGPSGGFCLHKHRERVGGNFMLSHGLARALGTLFENASVLDIGAGLGQYGTFFARHHPTVRWTGIDGAEGVEEATSGRVRFVELADGLLPSLQHSADWVLALEVIGQPRFSRLRRLVAFRLPSLYMFAAWRLRIMGLAHTTSCVAERMAHTSVSSSPTPR